jgi:hypothetical protein
LNFERREKNDEFCDGFDPISVAAQLSFVQGLYMICFKSGSMRMRVERT